MVLIADSGSSKTIWAITGETVDPVIFYTKGYNPYHIGTDEIIDDFKALSNSWFLNRNISKVFFFGAGCSGGEKDQIIRNALSVIFPLAELNVSNDLHGAALALFRNNAGITCILGTGSSSALWDGQELHQYTPSLGYILGDEGSGTQMGIRFIKSYLRKEFDKDTTEYFAENIRLTDSEILSKIYQHNDTKRFLASFVPLMTTRVEHPLIYSIVRESLSQYVETFILTIPEYKKYDIGFCGSPAHYFNDILTEQMYGYGLKLKIILANPIEKLSEIFSNKDYR